MLALPRERRAELLADLQARCGGDQDGTDARHTRPAAARSDTSAARLEEIGVHRLTDIDILKSDTKERKNFLLKTFLFFPLNRKHP